jgi:hypothetical protein
VNRETMMAPSDGRSRISPRATATDFARAGEDDAGEYRLLYKYLRDRYANRVVLTFDEIEDLLGFSLPECAQLQREWWEETDPLVPASEQSAAWTLADRSATVNLSARTVLFEREEQ